MSAPGQLRHTSDELLHAYAARQVHPGERAVISAHLQVCPQCRVRFAAVEKMCGLLSSMAPLEPDEMRWRWMSQRIRTELEARTERDLHGRGAATVWRWAALGAGMVAAGAAVFVVDARTGVTHFPTSEQARAVQPDLKYTVITPESARAGDARGAAGMPADARRSSFQSGGQALDLTIGAGAALRLAPNTHLVAYAWSVERLDLELKSGRLDVQLPIRAPDLGDAITLRTPAFSLAAASGAFSVAYEASASSIEVHEGEVRASPASGGPAVTLHAGEGQVLPTPGLAYRDVPAAEVEPQRAERSAQGPTAVDHGRPADQRARRERRSMKRARTQDASEAPTRLSSEGETTIQVIGAPSDPIAELWSRADAAYGAGEFDTAIAIARQIVQDGGQAREVKQANELMCRVFISRRQPNAAIGACASALASTAHEEDARALEYRIATIYRQQLSDCRRAIEHYDRSIMFGRASLLDDAALLGRAHCLLEVGELTRARSDLSVLERRPGTLVSLPELVDLKERLESLERARSKD